MSPAFREIEEQAKNLPPEERARLAETLLESLQQERAPEVEAAWELEIQRRIAAYRRGDEEVIDGETVLAELRQIADEHIRFLAAARRELLAEVLYYNESEAGLGANFPPPLNKPWRNKKGHGQKERFSVFSRRK